MDGGLQQPDWRRGGFRTARSHREQQRGERERVSRELRVVTVVPVTSNIRRVYPFQFRLPARDCGLRRDSKAQAEQIRAVAVERLRNRVGRVPQRRMNEVDAALRLHLSL